MYFLLVRRRVNGVAIPNDQLRKIKPLRADIHIGDHHSEPLGRVATQAWVFNPTPAATSSRDCTTPRSTGWPSSG